MEQQDAPAAATCHPEVPRGIWESLGVRDPSGYLGMTTFDSPRPLAEQHMPSIGEQIFWLVILAIPIACVSRTVVYEEIFREPRDWCKYKSERCASLLKRKFFYVFTCEYCFSHWVTLFFLILTRYKLLMPDWRGYLIAWFALIFVANAYLNLYSRLRVEITSEKKEIERKEKEIKRMDDGLEPVGAGPRERD